MKRKRKHTRTVIISALAEGDGTASVMTEETTSTRTVQEEITAAEAGTAETVQMTSDGTSVPETGDHMNLTLWLVILIAAALAFGITLIGRRKTDD